VVGPAHHFLCHIPHPVGQKPEQTAHGRVHGFEPAFELDPRDRHQFGRLRRDGGRHVRAVVDERHFPKDIVRAEPRQNTRAFTVGPFANFDDALANQIGLIAVVTLSQDDLVGLKLQSLEGSLLAHVTNSPDTLIQSRTHQACRAPYIILVLKPTRRATNGCSHIEEFYPRQFITQLRIGITHR